MAAAKSDIRPRIRRIRNAIRPEEAGRAAEAAARHLLTLEESKRARVVALYAPVQSELDTAPAARALLERGAALAYPRVLPGKRRLLFHRVSDLSDLQPGTFGIPEPPRSAPVVPVERLDLLVVPGIGFDPCGVRLGWGKGYYDFTLAGRARPPLVGYAFQCQILDYLPRGPRDVAMDYVVTETGARRCRDGVPKN